ncbi:MAG: class I SAM-dependent methyltransferase [Chloroflexota bacterium]
MFQKYIDSQYRRPRGIVGRWIGRKMVQQHQPENLWTIGLLDVKPDDQILEVGFGAGFAIQEIAKRLVNGQVSGVDFSAAMVQAASQRSAKAVQAGRVKLVEGDAAQLPFPDNSFDKAFSIHSIYFWPDAQAALKHILRVLKPGGMLVVTFLPTERWQSASLEEPAPTPTFTPYSGAKMQNLLTQMGFVKARIETDNSPQNRSNFSVASYKE